MKINNCRAARAQMAPFLSGELAPENAAQVSAHLEECAACADYAAAQEETARAIDAALASDARAPLTLDARVMSTVRRAPARGRAWPRFEAPWARARQLRLATAVASALVLGFVGGQLWRAPRAPGAIAPVAVAPGALAAALPPDDLARSYRLMKNGVMTRAHSEAQVAAQLRAIAPQGADFNIELVALRNPDARLVGGCWIDIGGRFVPSFCYEWKGRRASIFQAPSGASETGMLCAQRDEVATVSWKQGDRTFALVTESAPAAALQLAHQVSEI